MTGAHLQALGHVYGPLLNSRPEWDNATALMGGAPYQGAPRAPVLYVKPANTFNAAQNVVLPAGVEKLAVGATVSLIFMPNWQYVQYPSDDLAIDNVAWCQLMIDWHLPHDVREAGYFRPPLKFNGHDGFLGLGSKRVAIESPETIGLALDINGKQVLEFSLTQLVRDPQTLLREVCAFMTPQPLDGLMLGLATDAGGTKPTVGAGDLVRLHSPTHPMLGGLVQRVRAAPARGGA